MKTRTKKPAASKSQTTTTPAAGSKYTLPPSESNPPKLFVLPTDASPEARVLTLPHPATSKPTRYFVDPARGFYEFTRVSAPKKARRSVLLAHGVERSGDGGGAEEEEGYILQSPDLFIATPIDTLFLILPALWSIGNTAQGEEWSTFYDRLFPSDDERYKHLRSVFQSQAGHELEERMEGRMRDICDTIEMGDETSYKLSISKLAQVMYGKAERMVRVGLPASMEEHFVRKALEAPERSVKREDSTLSIEDESPVAASDEASTTTAVGQQVEASAHLHRLLRLRTALNYLSTAYIPPALSAQLQTILNSFVDSAPLTAHLTHLARLKAEAHALRSISDNISRKRGVLDDEDALERADVKKQKREEEEAKKKSRSLGVRKLMGVDVKGMKKMSDFFGKHS
ncbi:hypothetical protein B0A55_11651 [Friedmanniomyces simplex]|uniref:Ribonuclease H2 subunit B n=1 Tax=Friedmanniomyces simplex TaxID=329884 RepID=A0A4U0WKW1_9PEZI|nr:hypothetical protein B0A55_11651 [Friedmanniomyces simplex]